VAVVQSRLRARMEPAAEVVLRQRFCRASKCGVVFWICQRCDRGQQYCSDRCREKARREQRRAANRRHQQSPEGRLDHRDRQRAYRQRQVRARVTDQASRAPSATGNIPLPVFAPPVATEEGGQSSLRNIASPGHGVPYCVICGQPGRFINPFQPPRGT